MIPWGIMELWLAIRRRGRALIAPALLLLLTAYFAYHTVQGQRGLIAYARLSLEVERAEAELRTVAGDKRAIEARVALLHPDHVEPDMLDEQTRRILGLAHPDEVVIYLD